MAPQRVRARSSAELSLVEGQLVEVIALVDNAVAKGQIFNGGEIGLFDLTLTDPVAPVGLILILILILFLVCVFF